MKRLVSTGASRAWFVVAVIGLVTIALVVALKLIPRLGAGQDVISAARPAFTDERVAGARAGADFISAYVDLADPLIRTRGGASREIETLIGIVTRRTDLSRREVAAALRREAPHIEALLRALPLSGVTREIPRLTNYLATTLDLTTEGLAAELETSFPKLSQTLTALPAVTGGWRDVPGTSGFTRFDGTTRVRTVARTRDYFNEDLVAAVSRNKRDFQDVATDGGVGYIPWLLLVLGLALLVSGLVQALRGAKRAPGRTGWTLVAGAGVFVLLLVLVLNYFPRLNAADRVLTDLDPAFAQSRVEGARAGADIVHQTVLFGDPIATRRGGAGAEVPELVAFVSQRTNVPRRRVLAALRRRAPRTTALLQAIPLSSAAAEIPHLLTFLQKRLKLRRAKLITTLEERTPAVAQVLLGVRPVAIRWNSIPNTAKFTRFDGETPVRSMAALDAYLGEDLVRVLESQRRNFRDFADPWPPLNYLPPLIAGLGGLLLLYGLSMRWLASQDAL